MTAEIPATPSIHGLKRECLSYGEVLAQSFAVLAPTTVPAAVMGLVYASSGNGTWLSFLLGMIGLVFVGININQFARRSASPGSLYSYIVKGLGVNAGVLSGWGLILAYLFTGMSTLCGFAIFGQKLLSYVGIHTHILTLFAVGVVAAWYAAYKDIQLSAKMMLLLEAASIVSILLLGLLIWGHHGFAIDTPQFKLEGTTPGGITAGIVLAVFGFSGFESSTSLGDEAKDPLKSIPKSVMQSTVLAGLFFIAMAYIEVLGFRGASIELAKTEAPLDYLAHQAGADFLGVLISLGALLSFFACTLGCINPTARVMFLMARHGVLPASLGAAHDENLTPHTAIALASILTFAIPATVQVLGVTTFESQGYFGTICTYGFLLVYVLISIAAPVYLHRLGKLRPMNILFSVLGVGFMMLPVIGTIGIPGSNLFPAPEAPANVFPYLFALYIAIGFGWFVLQCYRSPRLVSQMQRSIEAIHLHHAEVDRLD